MGREISMCKRYINWLPLECPQLGTQPATQACALTGNRTSNLSVHRLALNPLSHTSQGQYHIFLNQMSYYVHSILVYKSYTFFKCIYI